MKGSVCAIPAGTSANPQESSDIPIATARTVRQGRGSLSLRTNASSGKTAAG
jgi:hypothetical protein